jgi:hypothetical protein
MVPGCGVGAGVGAAPGVEAGLEEAAGAGEDDGVGCGWAAIGLTVRPTSSGAESMIATRNVEQKRRGVGVMAPRH